MKEQLISREQTIGDAYFIIPGLFDSGISKDIAGQLDFSQLTSLASFSRGELKQYPVLSDDFPLLNILCSEQQSDFNYASLTFQRLRNEGKINLSQVFSDDYYVYQVSPIYLKADMNRLLLQADLTSQLKQQEVLQLSEQINQYFASDQKEIKWQLIAVDAMHWYCVSDQPLENAQAVSHQVGKSVDLGFSSSAWQSIQTELQMWLFNCQLNQQRQQQGLLPVNSLWLWGGGKRTDSIRLDNPFVIDSMLSDNPFNEQFASQLAIEYQDLSTIKKLNSSAKNIVIAIEQLRIFAEQNNWYDYFQQLQILDQQWFLPLQHLLRNKNCKKIVLIGDVHGNGLVLQQKDWSLFGRIRSFIHEKSKKSQKIPNFLFDL